MERMGILPVFQRKGNSPRQIMSAVGITFSNTSQLLTFHIKIGLVIFLSGFSYIHLFHILSIREIRGN